MPETMPETIFNHLLWSTVTAALALAAVWLLRKQSASLRCLILLLAVARFAVPTTWFVDAGESLGPEFPSLVNIVAPVHSIAAEEVAANDVAPVMLEQTEVPAELLSPEDPISEKTAPVAGAATQPSPGIPWTSIAGALWAAGVVVLAFMAWRRSRTRWAEAREPNVTEREALWLAAEKIGTRTIPVLRIVDRSKVPSARGWWNATVLLPDGLSEELGAEELDAVLAHEAAHLKRLDNLWGAVVLAVTALFWFHPLVWLLRHRFYVERETACDEMVLAAGAEPGSYADAIAKVCQYATGLGAPGYLTASIGGANLKRRMKHILRATPVPLLSRSWAGAAMVVLAGTLIIPMTQGLAQAPRDVISSSVTDSTTAETQLRDHIRQKVQALNDARQERTDNMARQTINPDFVVDPDIEARVRLLEEQLGAYEQQLAEAKRADDSPKFLELLARIQEARDSLYQLGAESARRTFAPGTSPSTQRERLAAKPQQSADGNSTTSAAQDQASNTDTTLLDFYRQEIERVYQNQGSDISDVSTWPDEMVRGMYLTEVAHDYAGGIEAFEKLVEQDPQEPKYRSMLGNVYVRAERYEDALQAYDAELSLLDDPVEQAKVWFKKGETLRRADNYPEAIEAFQESSRLDPEDVAPVVQAALLYLVTGRYDEEIAQYKQVLKLDPDNVIALNNLAYGLVESGGDLSQALDYAERAQQLQPDNAEIQDTAGLLQLENGKLDDAVRSFKAAMDGKFDSATFQGHLLAALDAKTNPTPEEAELRQVLRQAPSRDRDSQIHSLLREIVE